MLPGAAPFPAPSVDQPRLRVGLLFADGTDYRFFAPVLMAIQTLAHVEAVVAIRVAEADIREAQDESLLGQLLQRIDARRRKRHIEALRAWGSAYLQGLPLIDLTSSQPEDRATNLQDLSLDVILRCTFAALTVPAAAARHGVWRLQIAGQRAPVAQRLVDRESLTRIQLISESEGAEPKSVGESVVNRPGGLSLVTAAETEGCAAAEMIAWAFWKLHEHGQASILERPLIAEESAAKHSPSRSMDHLADLWDRLCGAISKRRGNLTIREWQLGIRRWRGDLPWNGSWDDFSWLEALPGHYLADPFLIRYADTTWLFAEDYDYAATKGRLACAPLDANGRPGTWQTVLDLPCHLSYPYVFEHDGAVWMIPESGARGCVELYRAERFPDRWIYVRRLWDGPGLDTVAERGDDGLWYFFTSVQSSSQLPPQQLIFSAPDLFSAWTLHPSSPISLDVRSARNGGRILHLPGINAGHRRIRVSQDGTGRYGSRLRFSEITAIGVDRYCEVPFGERLPPDGRDGVHHYERHGDWEVIDSARLVQAPGAVRT